jgi:hypothetical protein
MSAGQRLSVSCRYRRAQKPHSLHHLSAMALPLIKLRQRHLRTEEATARWQLTPALRTRLRHSLPAQCLRTYQPGAAMQLRQCTPRPMAQQQHPAAACPTAELALPRQPQQQQAAALWRQIRCAPCALASCSRWTHMSACQPAVVRLPCQKQTPAAAPGSCQPAPPLHSWLRSSGVQALDVCTFVRIALLPPVCDAVCGQMQDASGLQD